MKMSTEVKEHIAGMVFYSALFIPITCLMLVAFLVTGWSSAQGHIGEYVVVSTITTLGWFHQITQ